MCSSSICPRRLELLPLAAHQLAPNKFIEALEDQPADPSKYANVSIAQVAKADEELLHLVRRDACLLVLSDDRLELVRVFYPRVLHPMTFRRGGTSLLLRAPLHLQEPPPLDSAFSRSPLVQRDLQPALHG